jgi:sec-independent protein translocase protein TatB
MFDIGATELLLIVIVAVIVIGPKDMPLAMRTAGRWIGKMRKLSSHFRSGIDAMVREAELEDMERKWKAQNEKIMRQHPHGTPDEMEPTGAYPPKPKVTDASAADAPPPTAELAAKGADEGRTDGGDRADGTPATSHAATDTAPKGSASAEAGADSSASKT